MEFHLLLLFNLVWLYLSLFCFAFLCFQIFSNSALSGFSIFLFSFFLHGFSFFLSFDFLCMFNSCMLLHVACHYLFLHIIEIMLCLSSFLLIYIPISQDIQGSYIQIWLPIIFLIYIYHMLTFVYPFFIWASEWCFYVYF